MNYRDTIVIQEYTEVDDPLGNYKEWQDWTKVHCRKVKPSVQAQADFDQIGHSEVELILKFPGAVDFDMESTRFRDGETYYEMIEPPKIQGGIKKTTTIAVKEVEGPDA